MEFSAYQLQHACAQSLSYVQLFATPFFFRQEYWSGLPFPPPGDLHGPGMERVSPVSPALQADSFTAETLEKP